MRDKSSTILVLLAIAAGAASCGAEHFSDPVDASLPPDDALVADLDIPDPIDGGVDEPEDSTPPPPPLGVLGAACTAGGECDSGFCADSVCCKEACDGACRSCAMAGKKGMCLPHALASDPDNECKDDPADSCGLDGFCDGAGACHKYAKGTECGLAVCTATSFTPRSECDGAGTCQKAAVTTCQKFTCLSPVACRTLCNNNTECVSPNACLAGVCGGIRGQYYNNVDFTTLALTRVDPSINFDWMGGSPAPTVGADLFSVRWTGTLTARFTETYTFYIQSSDGERLFIDNTPVINNFVDHTATMEDMGTFAMEAGKAYAFKLEYYERYTNASIKLSWQSPSEPKAVIPTGAYSPPAP